MNLGYKDEMPQAVAGPTKSKEKPKTVYPSTSFRSKLFDRFMKSHPNMQMGDEATATVRLRCSGMANREYDKSIDFEILELNNMRHESGDANKELDDMDEK